MPPARKPTQNQSDDQGEAPAAPQSNLSMLAQREFGGEFHGEVEQPPKTPDAPDAAPPVQPEGDEPPLPDDDDYQPDENVQVEGDDAEAALPAAAEAEAEPISTVRELVDHLEADPKWFNSLKVDVTVNDQTSQVPLKELVDNYQIRQAADERLEMTKTKSAQAQQEFAQRSAAIDVEYQKAAKLVLAHEQQLMSEAAGINWDQLKREDPAMWSAERVRLGERQQNIQQMKQQTASDYQQMLAQRQQESEQQRATTFQEQSQLLMSNMPKVNPDWGDPQKAPEMKGRLMTYLVGQGFGTDEIANTLDHRNFIVAEKARLWDETQNKLQVTKKRIRTVPKVMKPGAAKEPGTVNLEKVRQAQKQLRSSGNVEDALTLLRLRQKRS